MQKNSRVEDQGLRFGGWPDPVSQFMYHDSLVEILGLVKITGRVGDLGGGNGILKKYLPRVTTIDCDATKRPDVLADILEHDVTPYDWLVVRYVLHYLNDYDVIKLFDGLVGRRVLVIQFVNEDLRSKYRNSVNETKYFRTENQLTKLISPVTEIYSTDYLVDAEFYKNRLGNSSGFAHNETIKAYIQ